MLDIEARILSGEPFTLEELKRAFGKNESDARTIEHQVREFHRLGYLQLERHLLRVTWAATPHGISKLKKLPR
jgi:hypothetical protein